MIVVLKRVNSGGVHHSLKATQLQASASEGKVPAGFQAASTEGVGAGNEPDKQHEEGFDAVKV
jgi:hypothetical protein